MVSSEPVSGFRDEAARQRFLRRYEVAFRKWPVAREELDVRTRFGTVHVHRSGDGPGPPVVLLHGLAVTSAAWHPNVAALAAHRAVFAVDMLGEQGRSVQQKPIRDFADEAAWIEDVLTELGLERAHVIGVSHGGWMAANYVVRFPDRAATLTLLDSVGLSQARTRYLVGVFQDLILLAGPRWLAARSSSETVPTDRDILRLTSASARDFKIRLPKAGVLGDEQLRSITAPLLVLLAERSTVHHSDVVQARLRALLPSAEVNVLPGVGHNFPMERPELVNDRMVEFLAAADRA
ncbi:alpha/beta fold hydrolase [Saccharopolyspora gloriosae]|uniref:alpha/beta fold hydrolase n=1 Tax=Saccharopolyspora gloriosae TaxID=455344 RepID=UPI001FB7CA55|nr:alpha/beta fold hydrolase [Saccharopolyspora gloriosae]